MTTPTRFTYLTNDLLPTPESWAYRLSGQRDSTFIEITLPGEIPEATLRDAGMTFKYVNASLPAFSAGAGSYDDSQGDLTTSLVYNIGLQEQDPSALIPPGLPTVCALGRPNPAVGQGQSGVW